MKALSLLFVLFLALCSNCRAQVNLQDGLLMYFPFNGNCNDESSNGYNAVNNGATLAPDRFGNPEAAYYFNGSANMEVPNTSGLNLLSAFSLVGWFKTSPNHNNGLVIVSKHQNYYANAYNIDLSGDNSGCLFMETDGSAYSLCGPPTTFDEWHLLVGTYNGLKRFVYTDGVVNDSLPTHLTAGNGINYHIGSDDVLGFFTGYIDDIRVYDRALSAEEIQVLFTSQTGITGNSIKEIELYPIPVNNLLNISNIKYDADLRLYNQLGQRIEYIRKSQNQIEVGNLPPGLYWLDIENNGKRVVRKFIKL